MATALRLGELKELGAAGIGHLTTRTHRCQPETDGFILQRSSFAERSVAISTTQRATQKSMLRRNAPWLGSCIMCVRLGPANCCYFTCYGAYEHLGSASTLPKVAVVAWWSDFALSPLKKVDGLLLPGLTALLCGL